MRSAASVEVDGASGSIQRRALPERVEDKLPSSETTCRRAHRGSVVSVVELTSGTAKGCTPGKRMVLISSSSSSSIHPASASGGGETSSSGNATGSALTQSSTSWRRSSHGRLPGSAILFPFFFFVLC